MNVWLVTPAHGRLRVTRMVLAQRRHLSAELAAWGVTCRTVVIADDENLELAREYGCDTIEMNNDHLGERVNAGFRFACQHGDADWVAFIGSDDWLHPDLLGPLAERETGSRQPIVAGHHISVVDMEHALLCRLGVRGRHGVPPWFLPRWVIEAVDQAPCEADRKRGIEGSMIRRIQAAKIDPPWLFHDPHDEARVDFKCGENMTSYKAVSGSLGVGREVCPWPALRDRYPADLVEMAKETHLSMWLAAA